MCTQVDAADAQVIAGPDEAGLEFQRSRVRLHRLLAAVPVCKRRPQAIPQKVVLEERGECRGWLGSPWCTAMLATRFCWREDARPCVRAKVLSPQRQRSAVLYRSGLTQGSSRSPELHHMGRPCCCIPPQGGRAQVTVRSSTESFICDEASQREIIICLCVQSNLFQQGSRHYQVKYARKDLAASLRPVWDAAQRTAADAETRSADLFMALEIIGKM